MPADHFAHMSGHTARLSVNEHLTTKSISKSYFGDHSVDMINSLALPVTGHEKVRLTQCVSRFLMVIMTRKQSPLAWGTFFCFTHWYCWIDPALMGHTS